jgi:uncharacterized protein (TIGR02757 family)
MHQVEGNKNKETFAFIASCLSYGSRKQFFPKIQFILDCSKGNVYEWIKSGLFEHDIPDNNECYYRLYTNHTMYSFFQALRSLLNEYGSMEDFVREKATDGFTAVEIITEYFSSKGISTIIPKNTTSACKRICMFLRWMVRDNSVVDLGLWSNIIDKRTLIMPLDTHVLQEALKLGLIDSKISSMNSARKLTKKMSTIFPDDPLKGDFALFGYGVNH